VAGPGCGPPPVNDAVRERQGRAGRYELTAAKASLWAATRERIERIWQQSQPPVAGDPVSRRLTRPGLGDAPFPECLRYHPTLPYYWHGGNQSLGVFPAMLAPLVSPEGAVVALLRTYLTGDGSLADVPGGAKKLTRSSGPLTGASIRLFEPVSGTLGICDGIETALAAQRASGLPTVAAYRAHGVATYRWPANLRRLVIFAQDDPTGRDAALRLLERARGAGLVADVLPAPEEGMTGPTGGAGRTDAWPAHERAA
jgi:putative DNA primase/helicase